MNEYNVYCDESCHLENDHQEVMVLGAVVCPREKTRAIAARIREIKLRHGMSPTFEAKWTKVSPARVGLYRDLVDFFFDDDDLSFRALVVPDKSKLAHASFAQTHDDFYYKMYFDMLKVVLEPQSAYHIYVDIKDTRSIEKTRKLHDVLCNSRYDFQRDIVRKVELIRSEHVQQVQLADLLIGAISYLHRGLSTSAAKTALVKRIQHRARYNLEKSTLLRETKVNLFVWRPRESATDA